MAADLDTLLASLAATLAASDAYMQVVIGNVNVTNNYAEIGFWSDDAWGNGWLGVAMT